ncbi:unnamed protein product [Rotaria magnacalcarata]|uniref:C2H2-type domain-containing protein n=1 Tax=Rotaria magnacalcarata TaxID=392030 RepID=A0A815DAC1_9BILA|nr:unnamed protein product [Rotaria magnacalcarata]CAF1333857.1 unnamed protein product [Rotaria magnacalcarata]CAF2012962.1 unnamed protein product [Rotaria magnacalcarata]CAF2097144.1 unnamed protein product [Rotaria magnacalcarata]CAF2208156.1 unnamed protein product [Rotaria magnacalcarata]
MTTSMKKQQLYGEYINPTIDQYSPKKENPLVLMAQACNNIGKEFSSSSSSSTSTSTSTYAMTSKQRKSNSPSEGKKSLKRSAPSTSSISPSPAKKMAIPTTTTSSSSSSSSSLPSTNQQSFYMPPSPFMFDSLLLHHLSKTFNASPFFSTTSFGHSSSSAFTPSSMSSQRSPYFMDSILAPLNPSPQPAFVCNWMESNSPDGFCGKRFANHMNLLEHLCTAHTSLSSSLKSSYPTSIFSSYYSPTSVGKL